MSSNELTKLAQDNNAFAIDLYHQLRKEDGNLFFSPYSISVALAMTYAGARGETESQMAGVLHFEPDHEHLHAAFSALQEKLAEAKTAGGVQLKIANSLWPHVEYPFLQTYLDLLLEYYGVSITPLDYVTATEDARRTINKWVAEKTEDKIPELISPHSLTNLTHLVLVNAIYFKGNWAAKFDPKVTTKESFWSANGQINVPMMVRQGKYRYKETDDFQVLELPYAENKLSMLVILPREKTGMTELEEVLSHSFFTELTTNLQEREIVVHLPKFRMEAEYNLNEALISMGISDAFTEEANFLGMDGTMLLYIDLLIHKAFINVNEEGTEAAAATAVVFRSKSFSEPIEFRADHPFLFLIRENETASILFIGRMTNP